MLDDDAQRRVEQRVALWLSLAFFAVVTAVVVGELTWGLITDPTKDLGQDVVAAVGAAASGLVARSAWRALRPTSSTVDLAARTRRQAVLRFLGTSVFRIAVLALVYAAGQWIHSSGGIGYSLVLVVAASGFSAAVSSPFTSRQIQTGTRG